VAHVRLLGETLKLCRMKGVDFNAANTGGQSILFTALVFGGSAKFIQLLLTYGTKLNAVDQDNNTVVYQYTNLKLVQGNSINEETLWEFACQMGSQDI